jgi:hypothetical protein
MSHENPGDGIRCDWCGCKATETREGRLGFLCPFRAPDEPVAEVLCSLCMERKREQTPIYVMVTDRKGSVPRIVTIDPTEEPKVTPRDYRMREGWTPPRRRRGGRNA